MQASVSILMYSMLMYRYAVNTRGRAVRTDDRKLPDLLARGFSEISKEQFDRQKYYPHLDKGSERGVSSVPVKVVGKDDPIQTVVV